MDGKFVIFSAPSGAGKSTIINYLLEKGVPLEFSISATTRSPRGQEKHGEDYYFLSSDEFKQKRANREFVESEEVFPGRFYGTLKSEVERIWEKGKHVIFDVDVKGARNLKESYGKQAFWVFIQPPSIDELRNRLVGRGTENTEEIEIRVARAEEELGYAQFADATIVNSNLQQAFADAEQTVTSFLNANEE